MSVEALYNSDLLIFTLISGIGSPVFRGRQDVAKDQPGQFIIYEFGSFGEAQSGSRCIERELVVFATVCAEGDELLVQVAGQILQLFENQVHQNAEVRLDNFYVSMTREKQRETAGLQVQREMRRCRIRCRVSYERA